LKRVAIFVVVLMLITTVAAGAAEASWFLERYRGETGDSPVETPEESPADPPQNEETNDVYHYGGWARKWLQPEKPDQGTEDPAPPPEDDPSTEPAEPQPPADSTLEPAPSATEKELEVLEMINEERAKNNLPPYQLDLTLTRLARMKAKDLLEHNVFSHESPTYGSPYDMLATYNVDYIRAGENLSSAGNIWVSHYRLMNSNGHRRNILHSHFTHVGIGVLQNGGRVMVAQLFVQW
jgi:uncharacterized protein YkwD